MLIAGTILRAQCTANASRVRHLPTGRIRQLTGRIYFSSPPKWHRERTSKVHGKVNIARKIERDYIVIAIETSCDDTSVAVVRYTRALLPTTYGHAKARTEVYNKGMRVPLLRTLFHKTVTANTNAYHGIHPLVALDSHRAQLAPLLREGLEAVRDGFGTDLWQRDEIDTIVAVTRGPGMRSNLSVGLDTAKGVAVILGAPLVAVNHMQAHALTPRLVAAREHCEHLDRHPDRLRDKLVNADLDGIIRPEFPFLSLLISGGHTMLLSSEKVTEHRTLAETHDIALGQLLDQAARIILPAELLAAPYGRALEKLAFESIVRDGGDVIAGIEVAGSLPQSQTESCEPDYQYAAPKTQYEFMDKHNTEWGWSLTPPLIERKGGESKRMEYSFAGLLSSVERLVDSRTKDGHMCLRERQTLAREVQRVAFEHLASRLLLFLKSPAGKEWQGEALVVSGGVAANQYIQHVLRTILDEHGYKHVNLDFPPIELATDNALMIAWAAIEMYEGGWQSKLDVGPIRKWSLDSAAADGGILGIPGWEAADKKRADR